MTFPAELERLKRAADNGDIRASECAELIRNHADAILALVRAAEDALLALNMGLGQTDAEYEDAIKQAIKARDALTQEFAKLNGEGK